MGNRGVQARDIVHGEHVIHCAATFAAGRWIAMVRVSGPGAKGDWVTYINDVHADAESALAFAHAQGMQALPGCGPPRAVEF